MPEYDEMPRYPTCHEVEECARRTPEMFAWFNAEIKRLESELVMRDATIQMAVARLGGIVEGAPTHGGNFLQRIDELRRIEAGRIAKPICPRCGGTGVNETGNNDLPCDCPAGDVATFNSMGKIITGKQLREELRR